jgi:hypothetical protein
MIGWIFPPDNAAYESGECDVGRWANKRSCGLWPGVEVGTGGSTTPATTGAPFRVVEAAAFKVGFIELPTREGPPCCDVDAIEDGSTSVDVVGRLPADLAANAAARFSFFASLALALAAVASDGPIGGLGGFGALEDVLGASDDGFAAGGEDAVAAAAAACVAMLVWLVVKGVRILVKFRDYGWVTCLVNFFPRHGAR